MNIPKFYDAYGNKGRESKVIINSKMGKYVVIFAVLQYPVDWTKLPM